ncbi:MAG: endonuclease/exonuclease/phosphatase family protein [Alphaproteobacteria bacterium]|nr:endonuclease/exonuclease/phosphatase family protein [Alphaproteobacteria bacterium]
MLRIVTWNVNSVRTRLEHIARFSSEYAPDVLCLQETKVRDDMFPKPALSEMGYTQQLFAGIPSNNGVAILAKTPILERNAPRLGRDDGRHLSVTLPEYDLRLDNVYVPAGGNLPDPELNDKFAYKLDFMAHLTTMMATERPKRTILLGDMNIAPGEYDVFSHRQMLKFVSHTLVEITAFEKLLRTHDWHNSLRADVLEPQRIYSWWSYRVRKWQPESRGLLLDHILLSPDLMAQQQQAQLAQVTRSWKPKPSDHAPLVLDLRL